MRRIYGSLFGQVCIALVLGIVIGVAWGGGGQDHSAMVRALEGMANHEIGSKA